MTQDRPAPDQAPDQASGQAWPDGAVIYQIYPRSFCDSNGDGVGDLKGVITHLDHVAALGVDGVWLSPFFTSPMKDFGYDVADFCDVDPVFGALKDFDALLARAHALGLKVIIDQVYSHSSDQHPWFAQSRTDRSNAKADWYVWADPKPDGAPPNNWQSVFGGAAWEWDGRRRQYYLHNFLASQPDLNLHHRAVQDAMLDVARFWLDRGVDGFRLDAINFAMHDPQLRNNPPAIGAGPAPARAFDYQDHRFNQSHADIPKFLERLRSLTDNYANIFTVAEVVGPQPMAEMKAFTAGRTHLTTAYNFDFLYADEITAALVKSALNGWSGAPGEALPAWAFSNHDAPRAVSRWAPEPTPNANDGANDGANDDAARFYLLLLLALRGHIFLYQGEELGLGQSVIAFEDLQDPEAIANWPHTLGRDGARTPMPWRGAAPHAGFSPANSQRKPWLPMDSRHAASAVDIQKTDKGSVLNAARALLALRRKTPALRNGAIAFLSAPHPLLAFTRGDGAAQVMCVFNLGTAPVNWRPNGSYRLIAAAGPMDDATPMGEDGPPDTIAPLNGYWAAKV